MLACTQLTSWQLVSCFWQPSVPNSCQVNLALLCQSFITYIHRYTISVCMSVYIFIPALQCFNILVCTYMYIDLFYLCFLCCFSKCRVEFKKYSIKSQLSISSCKRYILYVIIWYQGHAQMLACPVIWSCRIHRLLLCRGVRPPPPQQMSRIWH